MSSTPGLALRLIGPLLQLACFAVLKRYGGQGRTWLGVALETWAYAGFGLGLVLVLLGLTVFRARRDVGGKKPLVEDEL